jgi:hypothetical protein
MLSVLTNSFVKTTLNISQIVNVNTSGGIFSIENTGFEGINTSGTGN